MTSSHKSLSGIWLIVFLLFGNLAYSKSSKTPLEEAIYFSLNFEFAEAQGTFQSIYKSAIDVTDPIYVETKMYELHMSLFELDFDKFERHYSSVDSILLATNQHQLRKRFELLAIIKEVHDRKFRSAYANLNRYLKDYQELYGEHPDRILWMPYEAFTIYFGKRKFALAFKKLDHSIDYIHEYFGEFTSYESLFQLIQNLCEHYSDDKYNSIKSSLLNIERCENNSSCRKNLLPILHRFLGNFYLRNQDLEKGYHYSKLAYDLSTSAFHKAHSATILAKAFGLKKNLVQRDKFFKIAKDGMMQLFGNHPEYNNVNDELAVSLFNSGSIDQLKSLKKESDKYILDSELVSDYGSNSYINHQLYKYYLGKEEYLKALEELNSKISKTIGIPSIEKWGYPPVKDLSIHESNVSLAASKAEIAFKLHEATDKYSYLENAFNLILKADSSFNKAYNPLVSTESRLEYLANKTHYLDLAIDIGFRKFEQNNSLKNFEFIIYCLDKIQGIDLLKNLTSFKKEESPFIDSLQLVQESLKSKIIDSKSVAKVDKSKQRIKDLETQLFKIEKEMKLHQKQIPFNQTNIEQISTLLKELSDLHIIQYYYNDNFLYKIEYLGGRYFIDKVKLQDKLEIGIRSMLTNCIQKPDFSFEKEKKACGHWIEAYFNSTHFQTDAKKLIIPHKLTALIPWDLFFYREKTQKMPSISVQYSLSIFNNLRHQNLRKAVKIEVLIPDMTLTKGLIQDSSSQVLPLKFADKEFAGIQKVLKDKINVSKISPASFKDLVTKNNEILHLVTHAKYIKNDPSQSYLLLNNKHSLKQVTIEQLSNCSINSPMVVLSACETGVGNLQIGEGINSIARAFILAGTLSTLSTLWPVNDQSTSIIIEKYYEHLAQGLSKDEALKNAKLAYLNSSDPQYRHPYYWAGLVISGDIAALEFKAHSELFSTSKIVAFGVFVLILLAISKRLLFKV